MCFGELSVIGEIVIVCRVCVCGSCGMGDMERCIVSLCVLSELSLVVGVICVRARARVCLYIMCM